MILQSYFKILCLHNVFLEDTTHVCNTSEAMLDCNDWYAFDLQAGNFSSSLACCILTNNSAITHVHVQIKQPNKENADKPPINKGSVFSLGIQKSVGYFRR